LRSYNSEDNGTVLETDDEARAAVS